MKIEYLELKIDGYEDKYLADAMYRFWQYQMEKANSKFNSDSARLDGAKIANKEAEKKFREEDSFSYFGPQLPYSERDFEQFKRNLETSKREYLEAKAMRDYFMRYVFTNLHKT